MKTVKRMVLLGPPGVGKTTFGKKLSHYWEIPCICTGELIRKQVSDKTPLGIEYEKSLAKGQLLPDELSTKITYDAVKTYQCFILDGYPRRILSAQLWQKYNTQQINFVVHLSMNHEILIEKSKCRLTCSNTKCNAVFNSFHIKTNDHKLIPLTPIRDNICDLCGSILYQRSDDDPNVLLNRINTHYNDIQSVLEFYQQSGIPLIQFEVKHGINDFHSLLKTIESEHINHNLQKFQIKL